MKTTPPEMKTKDFRVRKRSFPQEISCSFEGTLDLYCIVWPTNPESVIS